MATALPAYAPLSVDQYHRMIEAGILPDGEPVELIEGLLVLRDRRDAEGDPMTHGVRHTATLLLFLELAERFRERRAWLRAQLPIVLGATSEPEPDLAIVRGAARDYLSRHPIADDVHAVIEIASSSLPYDTGKKLAVYARAGIPLYVVVDLRRDVILVHERPDRAASRYTAAREHTKGETFRIALGDEGAVDIAVAEVLPPA